MDNLTPEIVYNANLYTIKENYKEWLKLLNSKNKKDILALEAYRKEGFKPFTAESKKEYATITIESLLKRFNLAAEAKKEYIKRLTKEL